MIYSYGWWHMYENVYSIIDELENENKQEMQYQTDTDSVMCHNKALIHLIQQRPELFGKKQYGMLEVETKYYTGVYIRPKMYCIADVN